MDPIDYFGIGPEDYLDIDSLVDERIDQGTGGRWQLRQRVTSGLTRIVLPFAGDQHDHRGRAADDTGKCRCSGVALRDVYVKQGFCCRWEGGCCPLAGGLILQVAVLSYLDRLLEPLTDALTPESASALLNLRTDPDVAARIDVLRRKANEGTLTPSEEGEYKDFVESVDVVSIMQAKARRFLARQAA